jgi:lipopolysaccharide transport system ATP-binding protein
MSSELVIDCQNVSKAYRLYAHHNDHMKQTLFGRWRQYYNDHWVLRDISFSVRRGERIGIIGRNGAGKTTLLQIICGITLPTSGTVDVKGRVAPILALGAGFDPALSGRENALIGGAILGLKRAQVLTRMEAIQNFADIGEFFDQPLKHYSSGMGARLAFAICAHVDADVLIVDEALSVGDQSFQAKCQGFIRNFADQGTLLIVSHALSYLGEVCDRILWIEGGNIRGAGEPAAVIEAYSKAMSRQPNR